MKQKIIKILTLVFFTSSLLLPFIFTEKALAACSYQIKRFDPQGKTTALKTETLTFSVVVEASNQACINNETSSALLKLTNATTSSGTRPLKNVPLNYSTKDQQGNVLVKPIATTSIQYNLNDLNSAWIQNPSTATFALSVIVNETTTVATSQPWTVNLTGTTTGAGSGAINVTLYSVSGSSKIQKSIFSANETVELVFNIPPATAEMIVPATSPNLIIKYNINNSYNDTLNVSRNDLANKPSSQFIVSPDFGFQNNNNDITVTLADRDNNKQFWQTKITMQATGLPQAGANVIANKQKTFIGDTVNFTVRNVQAGWSGTYEVNNSGEKEFTNINLPLSITTQNGFKDKSSNTVTFSIVDKNGTDINLKDDGIINLDVNPNNKNSASGSSRYACKAKDNTYLCSTAEDFGLQEIDTTKCATLDVLQVDSCSCGKTDEQIKAQCSAASGGSTLPTDKLINPIPTEGLLDTFLGITKGFLAGLAIWAVIAIIFAGFRMVIAAGNEEAITQAKKAITWAILGLVVALLSFSIVAIVQNIIGFDPNKFDPQLPGSTTPSPSPSPSGAYIIQKSKKV